MLTVTKHHPHAGSFDSWPTFRRICNTDPVTRHIHQNTGILPEPASPPWRPCPTCWGQARIYNANLTGYWLCPQCLGVREIPST